MRKKQSLYSFDRPSIIFFAFFGFALLFVFRLFNLQVLHHASYEAKAQSQYQNLQAIQATRGNIYSRDGYPLAASQKAYLLYFEPKKVTNTSLVAEKASHVLFPSDEKKRNETKARFLELLKLDLYWVAAEHNILPETKQALEALKLSGIGFEEEPIRFYPEKSLASHVLGYVAKNEAGEIQGYFGIEGYFNRDLQGRPGRVIQEYDAVGSPILVGKYKKIDPLNGTDVVLTLDRSVQYIVEKRLEEAVKKYEAQTGTIIVMNPLQGEILAMANFPSFDPAVFNYEGKDSDVYKPQRVNFAVSETYEPGSVIKPLTVSTGIDTKVITKNSQFNDTGPVEYSGYTIDNWDGKHHAVQDMTQLLQKSNNIGSAWVAHQIGAKNLFGYFGNFGLGEVTGVELEGEDTGSLKSPQNLADIDLATSGFGQGISATPLQVLNSFNVIANDGILQKPRIVKEIRDNGRVIPLKPKPIKRVLSSETATTVEGMLIDAASGGEAKFFVLKNYKIAGKTGTAQIPVNGKYDPNETNATFVGYLPSTKKFSMIVRLNRPKTSVYAAETAVPVWMQVAEDLIHYYGIMPDIAQPTQPTAEE
jgi:cell division protein FtsI/penicillin-binding protein 2